jgi:hypothetical protein
MGGKHSEIYTLITMIKLYLILVFMLMLSGCSNADTDFEKKRHRVFREEAYKPTVLDALGDYEALILFMESNKDSLISYRLQSRQQDSRNENESSDNCHYFDAASEVPANLEDEYRQLISKIIAHDFQFAELCADGIRSILVNDYRNDIVDGRIIIYHHIYRNIDTPPIDTCFSTECSLSKDTMIKKNMHYVIRVDRRLVFFE